MPTVGYNFSDPALYPASYDPVVDVPGWSAFIRSMEPLFHQGHRAFSRNGKEWRFVKAEAAIAVTTPAAGAAIVPANCASAAATGVLTTGTTHSAFAPFAIGEYGWVMLK